MPENDEYETGPFGDDTDTEVTVEAGEQVVPENEMDLWWQIAEEAVEREHEGDDG